MIVRLHVGAGWKAPVRSTSHILLSGGLMTVAFVLWSVGDAMLYQKLQADRFDAMIRTSPPTVRISSPAPAVTDSTESPILQLTPVLNRVDPALIGRLEIPRLGLVAMVREGLDSATLRRAVGHMPGSALPGQPGNFVIAGHRDSFFRGLRSVQTGDEVRIEVNPWSETAS